MYRQSYRTELQLEASKRIRQPRKETAQILADGAECFAALRIAADAARMADSPGGAPGSRRLDLRHRRSHSNDQHLTVSASGSLSLHHHHQPHGASVSIISLTTTAKLDNRTTATHLNCELYVVTKQECTALWTPASLNSTYKGTEQECTALWTGSLQ